MGAAERPGPVVPDLVRRAVVAVLALALCAGCGAGPAPAAPPQAIPQAGRVTDTDVMFAQMTLAHIAQGSVVTALIADKATSKDLKKIAGQLDAQWADEKGALTSWLMEWKRPLAPDPDPSAHAGHGDLHALRPADVAEMRAAKGAIFDRTAGSVLTGLLHSGIETSRLEAGGGGYPPAISLAATMTSHHQAQVRKLLDLAAGEV
jgi:uncharacterized protein (DUF305 family)